MKKLFLFFTILITSLTAQASHVLGGEISWKCLPTGRYIFYMSVYRDCTGIPLQYQNETLQITGSPLPTNGVNSIVLTPDLNRFNNSGAGDTSPDCTSQYGRKVTCNGGDNGTVQALYYISGPVRLAGVPPGSGWRFTWTSQCCRPNDLENVNTINGTMILRALMYSGPNGQPADPCFDSSPVFRALPTTLICRGYEFTYNHTAIDDDNDSLDYRWDRTYDIPANNPTPVSFKPGYTPNSPTPGRGANINNIPATLDPLTGITSLAVYSGSGVQKFLTVVRVDAYKNTCGGAAAKLVSTTFREIPISLFTCPTLPNGNVNNVPEVTIDGLPTRSMLVDVVAGQQISIPVEVRDNDLTGVGTQLQEITMVPDGVLFSTSKTSPDRSSPGVNPCPIGSAEPCAYLRNSTPFLDTTLSPAAPVLKGLGSISTEFVWQTDCKHIQSCTGVPGTNQGVYNFVMRVYDDHCPIPALNYPTITVRVKDPIPMTEPILRGISANLDGSVILSWSPPVDSVFQLIKYEAQGAYPSRGVLPTAFWQNVDTNITNYLQDKSIHELYAFDRINLIDPNSPPDIFNLSGNKFNNPKDIYVRMRTVSGCTGNVRSIWSDSVRLMELQAIPSGVSSSRDSVQLTWNRSKPVNANSYPYYEYESATRYYIYANDSISNGGVADSSNWYLTGVTDDTTFESSTSNCNDYTAYRVEARDTVFIIEQGVSLSNPKYDTLYFSTFSSIDSIFTTGGAPNILNIQNEYLQSSIERGSYQWINCASNQMIPGETLKTFVPQQTGNYKVVASSSLCSETSACFEVLGIQDSIYAVGINNLQVSTDGAVLNWINCADNSTVGNASSTYVPQAPGTYKAEIKKFGFQAYSDCFTVTTPVNSISRQASDFYEADELNARYQWYKKNNSTDSSLLVNETERNFVPKSQGTYFVNLKRYGYTTKSVEVTSPILNDSVLKLSNQELVSLETDKSYQWIDCKTGDTLPNGNNREYTVVDTGYYAVIVSAFGYSDTSDCIPMFAVGLKESVFQEKISFSPNPTSGKILIQLKQSYQKLDIRIRNLQGQLIQENHFTNAQHIELDIEAKAGVYFVELLNEKGEKANLKVMKN